MAVPCTTKRSSEPPTPFSTTVLVLALALPVARPAIAAPVRYRIDAARSRVVAHLLKAGLGAGFAHDHVVAAAKMHGHIALDSAEPVRSSIEVSVDTRALEIDRPQLRRRYGMLDELSAADRAKVRETMRSPQQLDVARYPAIRLRSTRVDTVDDGALRVEGMLTLRGVTRPVAFVTRPKVRGGRLRASAEMHLRQSDFGYRPYRAALGLVRVQDRFTLDIYIEAERAGGSP